MARILTKNVVAVNQVAQVSTAHTFNCGDVE